ncbi:hypothetical protein PG984_011162 [Apiospora sp. TS-2023a]
MDRAISNEGKGGRTWEKKGRDQRAAADWGWESITTENTLSTASAKCQGMRPSYWPGEPGRPLGTLKRVQPPGVSDAMFGEDRGQPEPLVVAYWRAGEPSIPSRAGLSLPFPTRPILCMGKWKFSQSASQPVIRSTVSGVWVGEKGRRKKNHWHNS